MLCSCVQYQDGQKKRKPNYSSVDLSEVEWEDKDDFVCWIFRFTLVVCVSKELRH